MPRSQRHDSLDLGAAKRTAERSHGPFRIDDGCHSQLFVRISRLSEAGDGSAGFGGTAACEKSEGG